MVSRVVFLLLVNFVFLFVCTAAQEEERVEIESLSEGTFRGRVRRSEDGTGVNEFLGIAYAEPPVGDKRFQKTSSFTSNRKQSTTYDVIKMGPACPQYANHPFPWYDSDPGQSEDCLYLNIWTPTDIGEQKRAVKIYVHGGGWFETGSNRMGYYDGFFEALDTKDENGNSRQDGIIVATLNYRLGPLGFLSSGTNDAPGNAGLYDIYYAINWITGQIPAFGGDRDRVVVVGQGSGSIAVSLFVPVINRLPEKIELVLNGATFLTLKALPGVDDQGDHKDNNLRLADVLAKAVGCQPTIKDNPADTVACLKGVDVTNLMSAMAALSPQGPPNVFLPQFKGTDGYFPFDVYRGLSDLSRVARMNISASLTSDEGSHLLTTAYPKVFGVFGENDVPLSAACAKLMTRRFLQKFNESDADKLLGDLDPQPTSENRKKVIQAFGDAYFNCPMVVFAEAFTSYKQPIHFYMLERRVFPPYNPWAEWMGSVDFSDVQIDFVHGDGQLTVNQKTYKYNDEQMEQARFTKELYVAMANKQSLPYDEFTHDNPAYSVLDVDGKLSQEKNTNYHGRNCDILRPYFEFKKP